MDPIAPDYETAMDDAVDAPAGDAGVDGGAAAPEDHTSGAADAASPEQPAAPSFDPAQIGDYVGQAVEQHLGPLVQALTPQPEPQTFELDPFSDTFQNDLQQLIDQRAQQLVSPYQQAMEQVQQQQVSQWVDSNLDQAMQTYKLPDGSDGDRQAVLYAAAGFRAVTGDDAKAISAARDYMVQHDQKVGQAAVEAYKASLRGDNGTQRDPAVNGAAVGIEPAASSYDDVVSRWNSRTSA